MPKFQGIPEKHIRGIGACGVLHGVHYAMSVSTPEACLEAKVIAQHLVEHYPEIRNYVDVGCCGGHLVLGLLDAGVSAFGIDALADAHECLGAPILLRDATIPLDVTVKADAVICWEMAEHVVETQADGLLANLTQMSDTIFFSAGLPGYEAAHGHVNCQPAEYWQEKFEKLGYFQDARFDAWRASLRVRIEEHNKKAFNSDGTSYLWWSWSAQSFLYRKKR